MTKGKGREKQKVELFLSHPFPVYNLSHFLLRLKTLGTEKH